MPGSVLINKHLMNIIKPLTTYIVSMILYYKLQFSQKLIIQLRSVASTKWNERKDLWYRKHWFTCTFNQPQYFHLKLQKKNEIVCNLFKEWNQWRFKCTSISFRPAQQKKNRNPEILLFVIESNKQQQNHRRYVAYKKKLIF